MAAMGGLSRSELVKTVLLPNLIYGAGQGAAIPMLPLLALSLGSDLSGAALASATLPLGQFVSTLPAGWMVGRWGERVTMILGTAALAVGAVLCLAAQHLVLVLAGGLFIGSGAAVFTMARHAWFTSAVDYRQRGRVLSTVSGIGRLGLTVGPFLSTTVLLVAHEVRWTFVISLASALLLGLIILTLPTWDAAAPASKQTAPPPGLWRTARRRHDVLFRLGTSATILAGLRTSRDIIVPLWGTELGLSPSDISLLVGACAAVDFAVFYLGGVIMDRYGRLWVGVPTLLAFAIAHLGIAISVGHGDATSIFVALCVFMSLGNGIASGINAAMGSDLADTQQPAAFLGVWRQVTQIGPAGAPFAISGLTSLASLSAATAFMGGLALIGAVSMAVFVPRCLPHPKADRRSGA